MADSKVQARMRVVEGDITGLAGRCDRQRGQRPAPARRWRLRCHPSGRRASFGRGLPGRSAVARWATRRITPGYRLPARHVIHARRAGVAGWRAGRAGVARFVLSALARPGRAARAGDGRRFRRSRPASTAFPSSSQRRSRWRPWSRRWRASAGLEEVIFCCFGRASAELHERALAAQEAGRREG